MRISLYDQMCAYKQAVRSKKIFEIKEAVKKLAQKKDGPRVYKSPWSIFSL